MQSRSYLRRTLIATSAVLSLAGGAAGLTSAATAASAQSAGWVAVDTCSLSGKLIVNTSLSQTPVSVRAKLAGSLTSCVLFGGPASSDVGTVTVTGLRGVASNSTIHLAGNFTVTWPASQGLLPSTGVFSVDQSDGVTTAAGSVTGGAFAGAGYMQVSSTVVSTKHIGSGPSQKTVETLHGSLDNEENFG